MYRPEGWEKLNPCECVSVRAPFIEVYEAGADAMLEGLKKGDNFKCSIIGIQTMGGGSTSDPLRFNIQAQSISEDIDGYTNISLPTFSPIEYPYRKGYLVFIPEEA